MFWAKYYFSIHYKPDILGLEEIGTHLWKWLKVVTIHSFSFNNVINLNKDVCPLEQYLNLNVFCDKIFLFLFFF